jgi:serine protease AprX
MRRVRSLVGVGLMAALVGIAGASTGHATESVRDGVNADLSNQGNQRGQELTRFIVRRDAAVSDARFARSLRGAGLALVKTQPSLRLAVVQGPAGALEVLREVPGALSVARDYTVRPQSLGFDYTTQQGSMTNVTTWTGAKNMWKAGYTGNGIGVALLDTGIAPVPALAASDKVIVGPDLSFESQTTYARYLDSYGHGTVMGSIIAGRETARSKGATYAADTRNFYGMAPDARLISVKLADRNGAVDVSQVIAGIDWVVANRYRVGGNIRVINLSYGARSSLNAQDDPLSWAAEAAWKSGLVVVASAGNDGETTVGLASPAYNSWVIAVGATDNKGTATAADDSVAAFSNTGNDISRAPDLLAPGVRIIAPYAPGSLISNLHPGARIGYGYIRGNGTSQSAAVVSGAVALILSKYPGLTPDEVKRFLTRSASTIPDLPRTMQGKGSLQLNKILRDAPPWGYRAAEPDGNGKGSLDAARGGNYVAINGTPLRGEVDIMGQPWNSATMATAAANRTAWTWDGQFNGAYWTGAGGMVADYASWAGRTWAGQTWQGRTWASSNWLGRTWATGTWSSTGWTSATWSGPVAKANWAGATWSSADWR